MVLKEKTKKDILKIAIFRFLRIFFPKNPDFLEKYKVWGKKFFGISMTVHKRTSSKKIIEIGEVPVGPYKYVKYAITICDGFLGVGVLQLNRFYSTSVV